MPSNVRVRFIDVADGAWVYLRKRDWLACCDCGLVHRTQLKTINGRTYIRVYRDVARTKAKRRRMRAHMNRSVR